MRKKKKRQIGIHGLQKNAMQMIPLGSYVEGKGTYESEIEDTATYEMIMARQAADENEVDENGNLINGTEVTQKKMPKEVKTEPVTVSIEQLRDFKLSGEPLLYGGQYNDDRAGAVKCG